MASKTEARLGMDISDYEKKLTKATNELNKFVKGGVGNLGNLGNAFSALTGRSGGSLSGLMGAMGGLAATFGVTATAASVLKDSVDTAMNFEKSMSSLRALTGLGGEAMEELKQAAIDMGATTTQSASQVADAFRLIGSQKPELLSNVSALRSVTKEAITLAEASGLDVPQAASALTTSLNQMGEGADQASRFINVLAAGSQKGAGDINWLNAAITQSATAAKAVGTEYEELVAHLEQLAQGGFEAGSAGTALRSIIMSLEKQSNDKLKPSVVGLTQAFRNLGAECQTVSDYQKLVGKEFASQAMILANNADKAKEMQEAITGTATATEQAKINNDNFAGSINSLKSAWEGLMLTINDSNGVLRRWADGTTKLINNIRYLVSSSDKQAEMSANALLNGGMLDQIERRMQATSAQGWSNEIVTKRAQKDLDFWYYGQRGQHRGDDKYLAALELAYKKATQYVQEYASRVEAAKKETQNLGNALDNSTGESISHLKELLKEANAALENATTEEGRKAAQKLISIYEREIARMSGKGKKGDVTYNDGSIGYYQQQLKTANEAVLAAVDGEARAAAQRMVAMYEREIERLKNGASIPGTSRVNTNIGGITGIDKAAGSMDVSGVGEAYDKQQSYYDLLKEVDSFQRQNMVDGVMDLCDAFDELGGAIGGTAGSVLSLVSSMSRQLMQGIMTIANLKMQEAGYYALMNAAAGAAAAETVKAHSWIPFVGVAMGVGMVATIVSALRGMPKFAEGAYADRPTMGIFGEAGPELVLPERKLDEAFERNSDKMGMGGKVEFKIRDSELYGILETYNAKSKRRI